MDAIPLQLLCARCRLPVVVTLGDIAVPASPEATWDCPDCRTEHRLSVFGRVVSVRRRAHRDGDS